MFCLKKIVQVGNFINNASRIKRMHWSKPLLPVTVSARDVGNDGADVSVDTTDAAPDSDDRDDGKCWPT